MPEAARPSDRVAARDGWPPGGAIIVHADMDAFYAAVEQLDQPGLRGKPVLVGGRSRRGVVLTASYEARPFGVGSAMPMAWARRRCPDAIVVPPRFERYEEISRIIMDTFRDFSGEVEPLSLDEAFLDMSGALGLFGTPHELGRRLKAAVFDATGGLTVSVGISGSKYVAKVASAFAKPDGLTVVPPGQAQRWLAPQGVGKLWGAGPKTVARLEALGLKTIGDVAACDRGWLGERLGVAGAHFHALAHGEDPRRVDSHRPARSIGSDRTLETDVSSKAEITVHLRRSAESIARRLRRKGLGACGVRVKLKTAAFEVLTRQRRLSEPTDTAAELLQHAMHLLDEFDHGGPFRLVGMAAYGLTARDAPEQLGLFDDFRRKHELEAAIDRISERFGDHAVSRARDLGRGRRAEVNLDFLDIDGDQR